MSIHTHMSGCERAEFQNHVSNLFVVARFAILRDASPRLVSSTSCDTYDGGC
jgi:hypothetical protein